MSGSLTAACLYGAYDGFYSRDLMAEAHGVIRSPIDMALEGMLWGFGFGFIISLLCLALVFLPYVWISNSRSLSASSPLEAGLGCGFLAGIVFWLVFSGRGFFLVCSMAGSISMGLAIGLVDWWYLKKFGRGYFELNRK